MFKCCLRNDGNFTKWRQKLKSNFALSASGMKPFSKFLSSSATKAPGSQSISPSLSGQGPSKENAFIIKAVFLMFSLAWLDKK